MVQVYALMPDNELIEPLYQTLIDKTAADKKSRIQKFLREEDAIRCLFADLLIRYILIQYHGLDNEDIAFAYSAYGKPSVKGITDFHFNISHSGEWIVCATDDSPVGIDIELIAPADLQIADNYFSAEEKRQLSALKPSERNEYFYDLWTLKESFVKLKGEGLSIPLDTFTVRVDKQTGIRFESEIAMPAKIFFKQYNPDARYKMAVCASTDSFTAVKLLSTQKIINAFTQEG